MKIELGKIICGPASRDAVHVAVAPMIAAEDLTPGCPVRAEWGYAYPTTNEEFSVGIVDPFLAAPVEQGQRFWMFMMPNSVTDLRHEWSHPAICDDDDIDWDGDDECRGCS